MFTIALDGYRGCTYTLSSIALEFEHANCSFCEKVEEGLGELSTSARGRASPRMLFKGRLNLDLSRMVITACLEAERVVPWKYKDQMLVSTQSFHPSDAVQIPYRLALMQHCNKYCLEAYINHLGPFSCFPSTAIRNDSEERQLIEGFNQRNPHI